MSPSKPVHFSIACAASERKTAYTRLCTPYRVSVLLLTPNSNIPFPICSDYSLISQYSRSCILYPLRHIPSLSQNFNPSQARILQPISSTDLDRSSPSPRVPNTTLLRNGRRYQRLQSLRQEQEDPISRTHGNESLDHLLTRVVLDENTPTHHPHGRRPAAPLGCCSHPCGPQ